MDRRALLHRLSTLGAAAAAGCVAAPTPNGNDAATSGPDKRTPRTTETPVDAPTNQPTATDRPSVVGDPSADAEFPPGRDDVDTVVWYGGGDHPLRMEPSDTDLSLPRDEVTFTLHNGADRTFLTNFYSWSLYRLEDGRWYRVAPRMWPQPQMGLRPGGSHAWIVRIDNADLTAVRFRTQGTENLSIEALGGGTYAFAVDGWWDEQTATPGHEHETVVAAAFTLAGDPLELVPSDAVDDVVRDGDTVTVTATNPHAEDSDVGRDGTYVLTRDDAASGGRTLVTEQAYRYWPLRDALAHADDAAEVRVEAQTGSYPPFGVQDDEPPVTYDGRTYRVSATAEER